MTLQELMLDLTGYVPTFREVLDAFVRWAADQEGEQEDLVPVFLELVGLK